MRERAWNWWPHLTKVACHVVPSQKVNAQLMETRHELNSSRGHTILIFGDSLKRGGLSGINSGSIVGMGSCIMEQMSCSVPQEKRTSTVVRSVFLRSLEKQAMVFFSSQSMVCMWNRGWVELINSARGVC